jgi:restriction endonuclease
MGMESTIQTYVESDCLPVYEIDPPFDPIPRGSSRYLEALLASDSCPYCASTLAMTSRTGSPTYRCRELCRLTEMVPSEVENYQVSTDLRSCKCCGWWAFGEHMSPRSPDRFDIWHVSKLRTFRLSSAEFPAAELGSYLKQHPEALYSIAPRALERLTAEVFRNVMQCEARHVGTTGDGGIDVILVIADQPVLVQVKRRSSPDAVEGVRVVRELLGTLLSKGAFDGMVVSTAKRFSRAAIALAKAPEITSRGYRVELCDYDALNQVLRLASAIGEQPWRRLWEQGKPLVAPQVNDDDSDNETRPARRLWAVLRAQVEGSGANRISMNDVASFDDS